MTLRIARGTLHASPDCEFVSLNHAAGAIAERTVCKTHCWLHFQPHFFRNVFGKGNLRSAGGSAVARGFADLAGCSPFCGRSGVPKLNNATRPFTFNSSLAYSHEHSCELVWQRPALSPLTRLEALRLRQKLAASPGLCSEDPGAGSGKITSTDGPENGEGTGAAAQMLSSGLFSEGSVSLWNGTGRDWKCMNLLFKMPLIIPYRWQFCRLEA